MNNKLFTDIRNTKTKHDMAKEQLEAIEKEMKMMQSRLESREAAMALLQRAAEATQREIGEYVGGVVTQAMEGVFDDPYEVRVEFEEIRNQTEAKILFVRNGTVMVPKAASGAGTIDVVSFALRVALWALKSHSLRGVFGLDEPMRNLSVNMQSKAGEMIQQISSKMKLQMLVVSHKVELRSGAEKVFVVKKAGRTSVVTLSE